MPRKRGRQDKGGTDPSHPPTTPPQVRICAASPPATPAPKQTKTVIRITGNGLEEKQEEVEVPKTHDEIDKECMELLAEETRKREVAQCNLVTFEEEVYRVEAKWEEKLEDANEEIARFQQLVKEDKETLSTIIEKLVTSGLEVKERGKEIATLRKTVATLKKEKEAKIVGKEV